MVKNHPYRHCDCTHGVIFDLDAARGMNAEEVRLHWPRLDGECPMGCGYRGIAYASRAHYIMGDW